LELLSRGSSQATSTEAEAPEGPGICGADPHRTLRRSPRRFLVTRAVCSGDGAPRCWCALPHRPWVLVVTQLNPHCPGLRLAVRAGPVRCLWRFGAGTGLRWRSRCHQNTRAPRLGKRQRPGPGTT